MSMKTNLVGHWSLEAASGARVDDIGGNTLTDGNTVTQAVGKVGNAAQYTAANSEFLALADNAALSMGDIDFTLAAWVYLDSKTAIRPIISKYGGAGNREYILRYNSGNDRFDFLVSNDGTNSAPLVTAATFGSPSLATWSFVVGWHDSVANTLNIQINNGTVDSAAHTTGVFDGNTAFEVGSRTIGSQFFDGRVDQAAVWKRVLTTQERTDLYSGGVGLAFSQFSGTYTLSGSATPDAATGSGTGLTFEQFFTLSGAATPDAATGNGVGLVTTAPVYSLGGAGQAGAATGSGVGLLFSERPGNIVALTLAPRIRAFTLGDRS